MRGKMLVFRGAVPRCLPGGQRRCFCIRNLVTEWPPAGRPNRAEGMAARILIEREWDDDDAGMAMNACIVAMRTFREHEDMSLHSNRRARREMGDLPNHDGKLENHA